MVVLPETGAGTLVLNAANTFTGNTIINAGAIRMGNPLALQLSTLNFPTSGGGILDLNGYSLSIGNIAGNGGFDLKGGTLTVGSNNLSTLFTGIISDSIGGGKLVKVGTGYLSLTGNSSSNFNIIVNGGGVRSSRISPPPVHRLLALQPAESLWTAELWRAPTAQARPGHDSSPSAPVAEPSKAQPDTPSSPPPVPSPPPAQAIARSSSPPERNRTMNAKFKLVDPASGKLSVTKIGSGRWILSMASAQAWTYSGDTTINGGTLITLGSNYLPNGAGKGSLVINSGTLDMSSRSLAINALSGGGRLLRVDGSNTTATLTLGNGDASGTFSGVISDAGTMSIVKNGTGVQVFSGANSYAGATVINAGVLRFQQASSIGGSGASVTVNDGGIAAAGYAMDQTFLGRIVTTSAGAVALAANSASTVSLASYPNLELGPARIGTATFTGTLTPAGTTYRLGNGTGTLTLPNTNAFTGARTLTVFAGGTISLSGTNDYTGVTTINNGAALIVGTLSTGGSVSSIGSSSTRPATSSSMVDCSRPSTPASPPIASSP